MWVQFVNNSTQNSYVSNALTTGTGEFTIQSIPAGTYTVNISSISSTGPWTATGQANYFIGADVNSSNAFQAGQSISAGGLTLTDVNSKIVPGSNQIAIRNHADNQDNMRVTDSGLMTVQGGIIINGGGMTISAGPLNTFNTITASGSEITGSDVKVTGTGAFSSQARLLGQSGSFGAPTSGSYMQGDIALDSNATPLICSASGVPGVWHSIGMVHWQKYVVGAGGAIDTSSNPGGDLPLPSGFSHAMVVVSRAIDTGTAGYAQFGGFQIAVSGGAIDRSNTYVWTDKDVFTNTGGGTSEGLTGNSNGQDAAWASFVLTGGGTGPGWYSSATIWLPNYGDSTAHQSAFWDIFQIDNSTAVRRMGGGYRAAGTGAITLLHFFARVATMAAGTTFDLYMIP